MRVPEEDLYSFIFECVDSVPHLEALLQVWHTRPRGWSDVEIAGRLFLDSPGRARSILLDLVQRGLLEVDDQSGLYFYLSSPANDPRMEALSKAYRTDLIRISTALHFKASSGVREFARAFQFKRKDK